MNKLISSTILFVIILTFCNQTFAQIDRIKHLEDRLVELSKTTKGLTEKVEITISAGLLSEFLKGIAFTHNLNIEVSPSINQRISARFTNEPLLNVLLYFANQYDLDINTFGGIISIKPYIDSTKTINSFVKIPNIQPGESEGKFTIDFQNDTLLSIAKLTTKLSGKNIVVMPEIAAKLITGYVQNMNPDEIFQNLALANQFKITETNNGVLVLEGLDNNEELISRPTNYQNENLILRKVDNVNGTTTSSSMLINQNDKLITINVVNKPTKDVIKEIAEQVGIDYFIYSDIQGTTTANVQNMEFDKFLSYIFQSSKYTFSVYNDTYLIGERGNEGIRSHKLIQLKYRSVDSLAYIIPQELRQNVEIKEFKELNSFLLSGSQPQIVEIETFVKAVDKPVPMVLIEVILLDVRKLKRIETGIKMGVSDSIKTGGTVLGEIDFTLGARDINRFINQIGLNNVFNLGRVSPNFYVTLKALENNSNIELRQTPKLSTLNGHAANLSIGSTRYYSVKTQNVIGSLNPNTIITEQFFPVEANLEINIKPFVSGDNHITLNIDIDISDFLGTPTINSPPPSSSSKFKSIIRVKNEEMLVLGGIERNEKSNEGTGVPFLSRIPVIKWLFSSRTKVDAKTVSVVFIKPTIIH